MANAKDETQREYADTLYRSLKALGVDVLLDDRDERIGVKFKDFDLIGVPIQVVIGKGLAIGMLELALRRVKGEKESITVEGAAETLAERVCDEKALLVG